MLARPVGRAVGLGVLGFVFFVLGWPWMVVAPALIAVGALGAGLSVWRWERTRLVVTTERLVVRHGTLRRRTAQVSLAGLGAVEVEQSLLGRALGYGTLAAGDLEVGFVPHPRELGSLVARLAA